jgi:hypothetical protein
MRLMAEPTGLLGITHRRRVDEAFAHQTEIDWSISVK